MPTDAGDDARALLVLAHPDDETLMGATLGLLRAREVRVHACYVTAGEGGRAVVLDADGAPCVREDGRLLMRDPPSREALAQRRAGELAEALRRYGVQGFRVLGEPDVPLRDARGVSSRDADEFLRRGIWDRARIEDALRAYADEVRPTVLFTMLPVHDRTHAHHQAVGRIARGLFQAGGFGAAAQALYGFFESAWYGEPPAAAGALRLSPGRYSPTLGCSYAAFAAHGARAHQSQPPGHQGEVTTAEVFTRLEAVAEADPLRTWLAEAHTS